jgi:proteasome accessory factor A
MEQKIRGVEQELAMNTKPQLPYRSLVHLVGMAIEELKKIKLVSPIRVEEPTLDYMAYNGFRVYDDMSHLELSSPSYNQPMEAVIYDRVAELFGFYVIKGLRRYFKGVNIYKNNVSNQKNTSGWRSNSYSTHSSILMDYEACNPDVWTRLEEELIPFMIARIPVIGGGEYIACNLNGSLPRAGKYMQGDTLRYVISPRAAFIKRVSSNDTVDARGILNQRNDPHADPSKYWRLHDINWEAIRSPFQVYLRDCMEVLVMTAYEKGYLKNTPKLADPVSAIRNITLDTEDYNWKLELENGSKIDAIQDLMIGHYLNGIERMLENEEITDNDRYAFKLIEATLEAFQARRLEYFINGIDWVTKKALIDEFANGDPEIGLTLCNQFTALDDVVLEYIEEKPDTNNVYTTFNLADSLEFAEDAIPWENWKDFTKLVKHGLLNGPEGTRDYIRCLAVREFQGLLNSIEWESINFHNARIRLDEPFIFNKEMCGDILENSTNTFSEFSIALDNLNQQKQHVLYAPSDDYEKRDTEEKI